MQKQVEQGVPEVADGAIERLKQHISNKGQEWALWLIAEAREKWQAVLYSRVSKLPKWKVFAIWVVAIVAYGLWQIVETTVPLADLAVGLILEDIAAATYTVLTVQRLADKDEVTEVVESAPDVVELSPNYEPDFTSYDAIYGCDTDSGEE